jgi:hypothetical protein
MSTITPDTTPTPDTKRPRRLTDEQRGERQRERFDAAFLAAVRQMESRTRNMQAWAIVDPTNPQRWGRVVLTWGAGGSCTAVAWLPDEAGRHSGRHTGKAHGGGYDKATAAMGGARFIDPKGAVCRIVDHGTRWSYQIRDAGFIVIQAC